MLINQDALSTTLSALADPTRRSILARLARGPATVNELAAPFAVSLPAISRHLKVLSNAGLISQHRDKQYRPCTLEAAPLKDVAHYLEHYRKLWEARLDRLDVFLQELQREEKKRHVTRKPRKR